MATQVIQAALVGFVVWVFFMVFGVVAITVQVQAAWLQVLRRRRSAGHSDPTTP